VNGHLHRFFDVFYVLHTHTIHYQGYFLLTRSGFLFLMGLSLLFKTVYINQSNLLSSFLVVFLFPFDWS